MTDIKKHFWLYILELNEDKYYIGITSQRYPEYRIRQHKAGFYSAQWVKKYGYKSTLDVQNLGEITAEEAGKIEDQVTHDYMGKYGKDNVRGGGFSYSGNYIYRFGRFFIDTKWEVITVIALLELIILYLMLEKFGIIQL